MTGERTPMHDSAKSDDDDISLREHMQRQMDFLREGAMSRLALEREHTDERVDALQEFMDRILTEHDRRYEQRFVAQEQAVGLALARVDKEFHEHLEGVRVETHAALDAADKAIHKSEVSIEKRFDGVNEFRQQLSDQAASFMPRKESDVRMDALTEKIDANGERLNALQLQVTSRLDLTQGATTGSRLTTSNLYAAIGALGGILVIIIILANQFLNKTP